MTKWEPDFEPYMEIQYDLNLNESGYKEGLNTGFRRVLAVVPIMQNGSGCPTGSDGDGHFSVQWSGGQYDIYLNSSAGILQTSSGYAVVIYGLK